MKKITTVLLFFCTISCSKKKLFNSLKNKIRYIFSHGAFDNSTKAKKYRKNNVLPKHSVDTFRYPDSIKAQWAQKLTKKTDYNVRLTKVWAGSLAQKKDIKALTQHYETSDDSAVLFGVSRGASTALAFLGQEKPKNVKAVILESPFDKANSIRLFKGKIKAKPWLLKTVFWHYNASKPDPIDYTDTIDKTIPILLICSKQDTLIPAKSTTNIYEKLLEVGHKNVHLLVTKHGGHANIINGKDGLKYKQIVHAFYKKYNLPYMKRYAQAGKAFCAILENKLLI